MKCPTCKSNKFKRHPWDCDLMVCEDCHDTHSVAFCTAYWIGYLDGEKEGYRKAKEEGLLNGKSKM